MSMRPHQGVEIPEETARVADSEGFEAAVPIELRHSFRW
jgi:hypothetical protein